MLLRGYEYFQCLTFTQVRKDKNKFAQNKKY